jgi:dolichyl-phosphate beta-glucosyltransferase
MINTPEDKTLLVIPCYNEAIRLSRHPFVLPFHGLYILFVNDGSADNTLDVLKKIAAENDEVFVYDLPKNSGKAEAVRQGVLYAQTLPIYRELEWIGYWDADWATPLREVENFFAYAQLYANRVDAVIGSRIYKLGAKIERSYFRHLLGRLFATTCALLLGLECYDSQCGAKLFRKGLVRKAFSEPFLSRWIFDTEVLLRLEGENIIECPLQEWRDVPGGKLKITRELPRVGFDLLKIRAWHRTYGKGCG